MAAMSIILSSVVLVRIVGGMATDKGLKVSKM